MARPRKFADGGDIREDRNENIGEDTRERAMAFLRGQRRSGEAAPDTATEAPAPRAARPVRTMPEPKPTPAPVARAASTARPDYEEVGVPKPRSAADIEREAAANRPGMIGRAARTVFPSRSFPGKGPESSLPAVGGIAAPAIARGVGRVAGGLASAADKGWKAGEAEKAAARSEARYPRQRMEEERMEAEGPARVTPRMSRRREAARDMEEARMADEGGPNFRKGGAVKKYAAGGSVSASRRADGIAMRGKTRGRIY